MDHRITSAYHPQSNGLCEHMNQTIIRLAAISAMLHPLMQFMSNRSLQKVISDCSDEWDKALESVLFAIRTSDQYSTKYSPYEIAFGRKVRLPLQHTLQAKELFPMVNKPMDEVHHQNLVAYRAKLIEKVSYA